MPDTQIQPPAPSADSLQAAAASAQSRLDVAPAWEPAPPDAFPMPASGQPGDDFAGRLAAAKQRDQGGAQQQRPGQQVAQPGQPSDTTHSDAPTQALKWKRADQWNTLKGERDALRAQVEALKGGAQPATSAQPAPAATQPAATDIFSHPDVVKLRAERDEYYETVKLAKAEADPEFRARFDTRRESALNVVKRYAGGASDQIVKILTAPPSDYRDAALAEATKDFKDSTKAAISAANQQLISIDIERQIELETRAKTWDQRQAAATQAAQGQTQQRLAQIKTSLDRVTAKWQDPESGIPFAIPPKSDDPHAKALHAKAEAIVFGKFGSDDELAEVAWKAAVYDDVIRQTNYIMDEYAKLEAAYARVTGTQPDGSGSQYRAAAEGPRNGASGNGLATTHGSGYSQPLLENIGGYESSLEAARRADGIARMGGR